MLGQIAVAMVAAALSTAGAPALAGEAEAVRDLIQRAGNAEDDAVRLDLLRRLAKHPDAGADLQADARRLADEVDRWVHDKRLPYWSREANPEKGYPFGIDAASPLYPITQLYLGRMLTWRTLESGNIISYRDVRRKWLSRAAREFRAAGKAFPENRIIRMYLGEAIPWTKDLPGAEAAPAWARLQRENLERLADIITWWIDHRMQPDAQFGGGWGDDCEMWRWWVPVLLAFRDPKIVQAQARFSEALMSQPHMKHGYTTRMSDVEHTAEDSTDAILPMMHLAPQDPSWQQRARRLIELMETRWTGVNARGHLQFKSTYFTATKVDETPRRACDTPWHVRAVQPALLLWQRTGDEAIGRIICRWLDTWVDATARAEYGKAAGVIPAAIHWPEGRVGGLGEHWWDPRNHGEPTLYEWPIAQTALYDALLLAWHMTGRERYLEPLRSAADLRRKYHAGAYKGKMEPGSAGWCARELARIGPTLAKYRHLTGSEEFDDLLRRDNSALLEALAGDRSGMVDRLERSARAMRINFEGYTSEVRWTDRVLRFPVLFRPHFLFEDGVEGFEKPRPDDVYRTATGDPGTLGYFPLNAVRWLTPPRNIAAWVTASGPKHFTAEVYHFGAEPRPMEAELYLLEKGRYTLEVRAARGEDGETEPVGGPTAVEVTGPRTRIAFEVPPRRVTEVRVKAE
jgi:hypothetical protein